MFGKVCTKCQQYKFIFEFHKNPKTKDGYYGACKSCCAKYQEKYRAKHKEEIREDKRRYREEHHEEDIARKREYAANHRQQESFRAVVWQKLNKDKVVIRSKLRRVRERSGGGSLTKEEWNDLLKKYDYRCLCCGENKKLEPDHVIPVALGGSGDISNIQPLCRSCNASKGAKIIDYRERW